MPTTSKNTQTLLLEMLNVETPNFVIFGMTFVYGANFGVLSARRYVLGIVLSGFCWEM